MEKKKLTGLTIEQKKVIIDHLFEGESYRKLAQEFGVTKSTISHINKSRAKILEAWQGNVNPNRKRLHMGRYNALNGKVLQFYEACRKKSIPVNGPILQEKARKFAENLKMTNFSASNGWLERFRLRHNIKFNNKGGSSASTDCDFVENWKQQIRVSIADYKIEDIFSAHEANIFFRQIYTKPLTDEKCSNKLKEKIAILLCCSAKGEKLKPLVIGKVAYTKTFKSCDINIDDLPVMWRHNKQGWMTSDLLIEWLDVINAHMQILNRNILLLIDSTSSHVNIELSHIKLAFLPISSSEMQPLKQGILQIVKLNYKKNLLRTLLNSMDGRENASNSTENITIMDAIQWIHDAWQSLPLNTIVKSFKQAGFPTNNLENEPEKKSQIDISQETETNALEKEEVLSIPDVDVNVHIEENNTVNECLGTGNICSLGKKSLNSEFVPTHEKALTSCIELEKYALVHNDEEALQMIYGIKKKIELALSQTELKWGHHNKKQIIS